jgi:hypothetical protein
VQFVRSSQFVPDAAEGDQVISPYAVAALILGLGFRLVELHGAATVREEEKNPLPAATSSSARALDSLLEKGSRAGFESQEKTRVAMIYFAGGTARRLWRAMRTKLGRC